MGSFLDVLLTMLEVHILYLKRRNDLCIAELLRQQRMTENLASLGAEMSSSSHGNWIGSCL